MAGSTGHDKTEDEKREMLRKIVNDASAAFMVTRGRDGNGMHGRPMATAQADEDFTSVWFASSRDSGKVEEIEANDQVYLGYTNGSGSEWASINGRARIVTDRAKIKELWSPFWKNWFDGPDDPKIILIEVLPETAEYWDSGSRLVMLTKMAVAAVTGKKINDGEHETVDVGATFSEDARRA